MLHELEKKAFVIFLEQNNVLEDFTKALQADRKSTLEEYLELHCINAMNVMPSAFDFFRTHWPANDDNTFISRGIYWKDLNMKWRSFVVYVQHNGLPFSEQEVY